MQLDRCLRSTKPLMKPEYQIILFCSHAQQGEFSALLRSSKWPTCHAVREFACRTVGQRLNDLPGAGGTKFSSNFQSLIWAAFGDPIPNKKNGQELGLTDAHFPFGRGPLPQKLQDNLRLSCFSCRGLGNNMKYTKTVLKRNEQITVVANEYQKGFDVASHLVSINKLLLLN